MPAVDIQTYAVPKAGADAGEYEDAATSAADAWPVYAAVADGATESVFARTWAELLVDGLTKTEVTSVEQFRTVLPEWQAAWRAAVAERTEAEPWYVTAKATEGAFAALLGLSVSQDGRWRALSVGDCCLIHLREGRSTRTWPIETAEALTTRPGLVPSRARRGAPMPETTGGTWEEGDAFLLATDAVAGWLLERGEQGGSGPGASRVPLWKERRGQGGGLSPARFREEVEEARGAGVLRNDDATLLVLEIAAVPSVGTDPSTT